MLDKRDSEANRNKKLQAFGGCHLKYEGSRTAGSDNAVSSGAANGVVAGLSRCQKGRWIGFDAATAG